MITDTMGESKPAADLQKLLSRTPAGRIIFKKLRRLHGEYPELLGAGFWKKTGAALKKAGKVTGKITGRIAKIAAGAVGIPPSAIDALAKLDPVAHSALTAKLNATKAGQQAAAAIIKAEQTSPDTGKGLFKSIKPVYLAAGAGAVILIAVIATQKKRG